MEFKFTVGETIFIAGKDGEGRAAEHPGATRMSRQDALTCRCVSSQQNSGRTSVTSLG